MLQVLRSHRWRRLWWPVLALVLYAQGVALVHAVEHGLAPAAIHGQAGLDHTPDGGEPDGGESARGDGEHDDLDPWGHSAGSADCHLFDQVVSVLGCAADAPDLSHALTPNRPCPGEGGRLAAGCVREPYQARAPPGA